MVNYLDILAETIRTNWDQPALTDFYLTEDGTAQDTSRGNHYTYGEMYAEVCCVADFLTSLGLQKGDHIAICGANSAHWVIAYLAIAKMLGVSVTVMHTLQPDEIVRLIDFSDAKALFTDEDRWAELLPSFQGRAEDRLICVISLENWRVLRGKDIQITNYQSPITNSDCSFPSSAPDDLAMICFTSGTSGKAKGVMIPHRCFSVLFATGENALKRYKHDGVSFISSLPFSHIFGLTEDLLRVIGGGLHCYIVNSISPRAIINTYKIVRPIYATIIPQLLDILIHLTSDCLLEQQELIARSLLAGMEGDFIVSGAKLSQYEIQRVHDCGIPLSTAYGMTESPMIAIAYSHEYRTGTAGIITKHTTARISPAGEILVKGENVMLGYYKDPEATAAKIDSDGWLHTGDKGHLDEDGYLYVEGRLEQDIIVLPNGENIRPDNIESLINALPEVSESIVLARDGKLVAIAVLSSPSLQVWDRVRLSILRAVNPQLPLFSQLYDVEITDQPLARTEKQTLKRYLYS